ncbi:hypothetical protein ACFLS1_04670 [Verrucomicrobiota bacterium]
MIEPRSFLIGVAAGTGVFFVFQFILFILKPWRHALFSGAAVSMPYIIGMRLRGNPPMLLIDAYIKLKKQSVPTFIQEVEVVYIANKVKASTTGELVKLVMEHRKNQTKTNH